MLTDLTGLAQLTREYVKKARTVATRRIRARRRSGMC